MENILIYVLFMGFSFNVCAMNDRQKEVEQAAFKETVLAPFNQKYDELPCFLRCYDGDNLPFYLKYYNGPAVYCEKMKNRLRNLEQEKTGFVLDLIRRMQKNSLLLEQLKGSTQSSRYLKSSIKKENDEDENVIIHQVAGMYSEWFTSDMSQHIYGSEQQFACYEWLLACGKNEGSECSQADIKKHVMKRCFPSLREKVNRAIAAIDALPHMQKYND